MADRDYDVEVTMDDGRVIRNLTDEEYDKTYSEGKPHGIPQDVLDQAIAKLNERGESDA